MQDPYHGCHKKTETEPIKRLTTKEENDAFSPQTVVLETNQNEISGAENLSY